MLYTWETGFGKSIGSIGRAAESEVGVKHYRYDLMGYTTDIRITNN